MLRACLRSVAIPLTFGLLAVAGRPAPVGVVSGTVVDAETDEPIAGATLWLVDTEHRAETDEDGRFAMPEVEPGDYTLEVERLGYGTHAESIEVPADRNLRLRIRITPTAIELAPLAVDARSARLLAVGFYRRQSKGVGAFLTRDDIADRGNVRLSAVVARVAGMQRTFGPRGGVTFEIRGTESIVGDCRTQFFVDGVPSELGARGIDDVPPDVVEGIEIYRGSSELPARFSVGRAGCGAILIWTRTGG